MTQIPKEALLIDDNSKEIIFDKDLDSEEIKVKGAYLVPCLGRKIWDGHIYISGATGAGKSFIIRKIIDNDKLKRQCILFTDLSTNDPVFKGMNYVKYDEGGTYHSGWLSQNQNNKIMVFDDVQFNEDIKHYRDKMLEKGRHKGTVVICVNHKLKDYQNTKVPLNDARFVIAFPCSNRGSCAKFLKDELELDHKKIQHIIDTICNEGRHMIVHRFYPNFVSGPQSIFKI